MQDLAIMVVFLFCVLSAMLIPLITFSDVKFYKIGILGIGLWIWMNMLHYVYVYAYFHWGMRKYFKPIEDWFFNLL